MKCSGLILAMLFANISFSFAQNYEPKGLWFDDNSMTSVELPLSGDIPYLLLDLEYTKEETPQAYISDFNGDGFSDYLVKSSDRICGSGGCAYALVDGASMKRIGNFFGRPLLIFQNNVNNWPVIHTYAHLNVSTGNYSVFIFADKKYVEVTRIEMHEKTTEDYFKSLSSFTKIKSIN